MGAGGGGGVGRAGKEDGLILQFLTSFYPESSRKP